MTRPLKGIKVLDFTHLLPGELCSTTLSDMGCEVVRIEPMVPGLASKLPPIVNGESLYYWSVHRNKIRISIDLKHPEGKKIVHALVKKSDVLLENFRPGVMKRLGISYAESHRLNRKIIYCSISGYGHETSWSNRPGHDLNFIAESGVLDLTRGPDGRPVLPGALVSDYTSASYAALAIVAALYERRRTRRGKHIDISMFESALSTQQLMATGLSYLGLDRDEASFAYPGEMPNYTMYRCKDGRYIAVASLEPPFWKTFCETVGFDDLKEHQVNPGDSFIGDRLEKLFATRTLAEWNEIFKEKHCCVSPVNTVTEALNTVPAQERHSLTSVEHPRLGAIPQLTSPILTRTERRKKNTPIHDADHAAYRVLKEIGISRRDARRLADSQVIALRDGVDSGPNGK